MLRRLALPIGVVVLLAAIVVVSLQLGYLGRKQGGPLLEPRGFEATVARARADRWTLARLRYEVDGGRVRITDAPRGLASPGLQLRGPRLAPSGDRKRSRRFPPAGDGGPGIGSRLLGTGALVYGARVRRPGVYVAWRLALDYDQGARSYRRALTAPPLCVALRSTCPPRASFPAGADQPLADIGGPSDYGIRPTPGDRSALADDEGLSGDSGNALEVLVPARPGRRTVRFTLTNLTDDTLDVSGLSMRPLELGPFRLSSDTVPDFTLAPRGAETVSLTLTGRGCSADRLAVSIGAGATTLRATVDGERRDVPALVAFGVRGAERC